MYKLPQIDALRGIAVLGVVWHHGYSRLFAGYPLIGDGWYGVALFFTLSGFVLALPFLRDGRRMDVAAFYLRRIRRLYPLFALVSIVGALMCSAPLWSVAITLSTLHLFSPHLFLPPVNGAFWSLSVEVWLSALLPIILLVGKRIGYTRYVWLRCFFQQRRVLLDHCLCFLLSIRFGVLRSRN
jgi:peptidoglycan/LPS O-acetylase OafA/YrhL